MTPEDIRTDLNQAQHLADHHGSTQDRANTLALVALTEAVLHLAEVVQRDRVF